MIGKTFIQFVDETIKAQDTMLEKIMNEPIKKRKPVKTVSESRRVQPVKVVRTEEPEKKSKFAIIVDHSSDILDGVEDINVTIDESSSQKSFKRTVKSETQETEDHASLLL